MNAEFGHGHGSEYDQRTTGRWSRDEHEKFIEGKAIQKDIYKSIFFLDFKSNSFFKIIFLISFAVAMSLFGRDWKKV